MILANLFRSGTRKLRQRRPLPPTRRLVLETLEDRVTPALTVTPVSSANTLVQSLLGPGVTFSNATLTPAQTSTLTSAGTFSGGTANLLGFDTGVALSNGNVKSLGNGPPTSSPISTDLGTPGDAQLSGLIGGTPTFDATVLQFDVVPVGNTLTFQYVFGSTEYPTFINSFNDVFGFFVNNQNVALIPTTTQAVSINTVNGGDPSRGVVASNPQFFVSNTDAHIPIPLNGFTTVLSVFANVHPGVVNHVKIAVADASDAVLDSAVFIQAGSVQSQAFSDPNAAYVAALYRDVLGRLMDSGSQVFIQGLDNGTLTRQQVSTLILTSREHEGMIVEQFYSTFLNRQSDPAGKNAWVNALLGGLSPANVVAGFVSSPEYTQLHQSNSSFVTALYHDILMRKPSQSELQIQTNNLNTQVITRAQMGYSFLAAPEALTDAIMQLYITYLNRSPSAQEMQEQLAFLQSGQGNPTPNSYAASVVFLSSQEYFNDAQTGF